MCIRDRYDQLVALTPTPVVALNRAGDSVDDLRARVERSHAALYYPNLVLDEGGRPVVTSPAGAVAGMVARTDELRGVWRPPAGIGAELRGVAGLQLAVSDRQQEPLNSCGVNVLRHFPTGVVSWGARTLDGSEAAGAEYRYLPVRRPRSRPGLSLIHI